MLYSIESLKNDIYIVNIDFVYLVLDEKKEKFYKWILRIFNYIVKVNLIMR